MTAITKSVSGRSFLGEAFMPKKAASKVPLSGKALGRTISSDALPASWSKQNAAYVRPRPNIYFMLCPIILHGENSEDSG